MILECPDCRARYLVPDHAIAPPGRTVRCANCGHSWYQDVEFADTLEQEPEEAPVIEAPEPEPAPTFTPPPPPPPPVLAPSLPLQAPPAATPVMAAGAPDGAGYDAFAHRPPFRAPPRTSGRFRTIASIAAGLLMLAAVAVILWTTAPGLAQQIGLSIGPEELPLRIADNPIQRRKMANGSELFAVSGRISNPSATRQRVPDIRADLRDEQNRIVFSWTITPQQRTLLPGAAIDFNSAQVDVPASSKRLDLSFVGEAG
ncbi:MAG: hypothetical protein DI544_05125 [Sphingomonas taxi]|uniref:Zinc finger/thioredoxin putative domain-containing protein n=1 Tax=Sphingomonas taxi TaxID=1549858 RepID=A0A2W5P8K5_9SPHN|nr:MAG: hypothetical protein DI544_05125 [Sphingomonas taxi]